MTQIVGTSIDRTSGDNITVTAAVTSGMTGLWVLKSADSTNYAATLTSAGATFTQMDARAAGNMYVTVIKSTGLVAGAAVLLTQVTPKNVEVTHLYQDVYDYTTASLSATVRGSSISTCTTGSVTPASGQLVAVVSIERTTATGTTVSSVVSSGSETVTQDAYAETSGITATSTYRGTFTASAAAARTVTITYNSGSGNGYAAAILTTPIVVAAPTIRYTSATDTLATGHAYYTSATDTLTAALEVRPVPTGYTSVSAMLATAGFVCAHRGGSLDWPEMSLHAYTQAVFWGVGALEVSLARTSDGVWFGLHDDTLDRTSGTTSVDASTLTWAQIQASYTISASLPSGQTAKPYMRWEEIIAAYYTTHVLFVDIKSHLAFTTELLNMFDALPGTPTARIVGKGYGVASSWPAALTARSYQSWGYFYQADSANFAAYVPNWSIIGLDYLADAATWTAMRAQSGAKKVMAHIIPSSGGMTTAVARGADGYMVSGVVEAVTRST